jgi:hypothetical protein
VGTFSFTAEGRDAVGNANGRTVRYTVAYSVCLLFDPTRTRHVNSTTPIKVQLCDASGANRSEEAIAVRIDVDGWPAAASGKANEDGVFCFDPGLGGYIFNLSTRELAVGIHTLTFEPAGDPTVHSLDFRLD